MAWITINFGRKPRNGGSPPRDSTNVNIMNFISVTYLFVIIIVWLINDAPDNLIAGTTVSASVTGCSLQHGHHSNPTAPNLPTHNEPRTKRPIW